MLGSVLGGATLIGCGSLLGSANVSRDPPIEFLDERTGVTVATLAAPLELVQSGRLPRGKRANFVYVGPVEWDRMGDISYALWIHVAQFQDKRRQKENIEQAQARHRHAPQRRFDLAASST